MYIYIYHRHHHHLNFECSVSHDFTHRIPGPLARDGHWRNTFELLEQGRVCRIDTPQATRSWAVNACKEARRQRNWLGNWLGSGC